MVLEAKDVHKSFPGADGPVPVLRGVSLSLKPGDSVALTGESGSGKSTLLHLLGALDSPDRGEITIAGDALGGLDDASRADIRRRRIGLVFQQFNLIPSLTVAGNLSFQARLAGREAPDWTSDLANRLGLSALLAQYPEQLSGGQQQRVAIGRALAGRPEVLLADEPTGNLDENTATAVLDLILSLQQETGAALLVVTHSATVAGRLGRRVHLSEGRLA